MTGKSSFYLDILDIGLIIPSSYVCEILQQTPESVEEVEVEPDGEWHTSDNKFGSEAWIESHRPVKTEDTEPTQLTSSTTQTRLSVSVPVKSEFSSTVQSLGEVVVLDSDSENEDETRVKKELSPATSPSIPTHASRNGARSGPTKGISSAVIDLTLDSEDEDAPPARPAAALASKRKVSESTDHAEEVTYKKSRVNDLLITAGETGNIASVYSDGQSSAPSVSENPRHSPFPRLSLPSRASSSSTNGYHHNSPPTATSPPAVYYPPHHHLPSQNTRQFIHYGGPYQQHGTVNGSGVAYNGAPVDGSRQRPPTYNPYLTQSNGAGRSGWP